MVAGTPPMPWGTVMALLLPVLLLLPMLYCYCSFTLLVLLTLLLMMMHCLGWLVIADDVLSASAWQGTASGASAS